MKKMRRRSEKGFSLIESLVAIGILSVVMYSLTYYSTYRYLQISGKENRVCLDHASETIDKIKSLGAAKYIAPLNPSNNTIARPANNNNSYGANSPEYLNYVAKNQEWLAQNETLWSNAGNQVVLKNYKAIVGYMSLLNTLYNANPNYCTNAIGASYGGASSISLTNNVAEISHLKNVNSSIRIIPYDTLTGQTLNGCPRPFYAIPGGLDTGTRTEADLNGIVARAPNTFTNRGFRVTVTTNYDDTDNQPQNCSVEATFSYPTVAFNPSSMNAITVDIRRNPAAGTPVGVNTNNFSACTSNATRGQVDVFANFNNHRTGRAMTLMCRDTSFFQAPTTSNNCIGTPNVPNFTSNSNWVPCSRLTMCGQNPIVNSMQGNGFRLSYANISLGCRMRVEVRLIDAEQNIANIATATSLPQVVRAGCNACTGNYTNLPGSDGWCPGGGRNMANSCQFNPPPPPDGDGDGDGSGPDGDGSGTDGGDTDGSGPDGGDGDGGNGG